MYLTLDYLIFVVVVVVVVVCYSVERRLKDLRLLLPSYPLEVIGSPLEGLTD